MLARTVKEDWFTNYLRGQGLWVGGSLAIDEESSKIQADETMRIFKGSKEEFLLMHILIFQENRIENYDYDSFALSHRAKFNIELDFSLLIWEKEEIQFRVCFSKGGSLFADTLGLRNILASFDESYITKSVNQKAINKSITDFFHAWARSNTHGFQNDIDALGISHDYQYLLELKRPNESVRTWQPYLADKANYLQLSKYTSKIGLPLMNIAYNIASPGQIQIFRNVRSVGASKLEYEAALVNFTPNQKLGQLFEHADFTLRTSTR